MPILLTKGAAALLAILVAFGIVSTPNPFRAPQETDLTYQIRLVDGKLPDQFFRWFNPAEEAQARQWARDNTTTEHLEQGWLYHPVVRDEWHKMGLWEVQPEDLKITPLPSAYIGTVIEGTTRPEDIVDGAWGFLTDELREAWRGVETDMRESDVFVDIIEHLNQIAPSGCYFGTHPDDGADWGFWPYSLVE